MNRNPANPFHRTEIDYDEPPLPAKLSVRPDHARTALTENDSPDVGFRWSINPYRGCTHACAYCYARRTHEHLDHGAGEDFERIVYAKQRLPELLRAELGKPRWVGEPVHLSGVTDPYQPIERRYGLTRACLEVLADHRNPVSVITRSPMILRALDLLQALQAYDAVRVAVSIPITDPTLARQLEPGAVAPRVRFAVVERLAAAGVPVGVSLAPILPGLTDHQLAGALRQAREAGATWAFAGLVRLPGSVEQVFTERLSEALGGRAEAVLARLRALRGGVVNRAAFGDRMRGEGPAWRLMRQVLAVERARLGLSDRAAPFPHPSPFRRPGQAVQLGLFAPASGLAAKGARG